MRRLNLCLLLILVLVVTAIPLAYASTRGLVDPFVHDMVAADILSLEGGHIDLASVQFRYVSAVGFLAVMVASLTGVSPVALEYVPIGAVVFALSAFILARTLRLGPTVSALIASVLIFRWLPPTLATIWPHTFAFGLFLLLVSVYQKFLERPRPQLILTIWVLFLGIHFYSYTVEVWTIAFVAIAATLSVFRKARIRAPTFSLVLGFAALFLGFNQVVYDQYLPRLANASESLSSGFSYWLSFQFHSAPPLPYEWVPPPTPLWISILNLAYYFVALGLPVLILLLGVGSVRPRALSVAAGVADKNRFLVLLCLILIWPIDFASYASIGAVAVGIFRYVTLVIPLVGLWLLHGAPSKPHSAAKARYRPTLFIGCAAVLLAISMVLFGASVTQGSNPQSQLHYADVAPGAGWFLTMAPATAHILADHNTLGEFSIVAASDGLGLTRANYYDPTSYGDLVSPSAHQAGNTPSGGQYVAVNLDLSPYRTVTGVGWVDLQPLQPYLARVQGNPNLAKIYDDSNLWIFVDSQ